MGPSCLPRNPTCREHRRAGPRAPPDTVCAACSEPIHSGTLALVEHGEWFHMLCRSRDIRCKSVEAVDHAQTTTAHAISLIKEAKHRQAARRNAARIHHCVSALRPFGDHNRLASKVRLGRGRGLPLRRVLHLGTAARGGGASPHRSGSTRPRQPHPSVSGKRSRSVARYDGWQHDRATGYPY
jgi:hypothetical protein